MSHATVRSKKRLWGVRALWVVIGLIALGMLAKATPGPSLDVMGAPAISIAVTAAVAAGYYWTKNTVALSEE